MEATVVVALDKDGTPRHGLVDAQDQHLIGAYRWYIRRGGYVVRFVAGQTIFLHREVMKPAAGLMVDHINGDKLDNRRENLRVCTNAQNSMNQRRSAGNTSGFKGVRRNAVGRKWEAIIKCDGKQHYLGVFDDPRVAAHAYNRAAIQLFGDFASLNPL
nr:HNH endonuclease [Achromobacter ruhlandii]